MNNKLYKDLENRSQELLEKNTRTAQKNGRKYFFTVPSGKVYPFQWFWDSCFHAIVWAHLGKLDRAKEELRALVAWQNKRGLIPHVIFWHRKHVSGSWKSWHKLQNRGYFSWFNPFIKSKTTSEIQPPVIAQAVEKIWKKDADKLFVKEMLKPLYVYYRYLVENRSPQGDGLISIVCQYESGIDYSPAYDRTIGYDEHSEKNQELLQKVRKVTYLNKFLNYNLRWIFSVSPFQTKDVLVNSIFIQGLVTLGRLADICEDVMIKKWAQKQATKSLDALIDKCYDKKDGLFYNLDGKDEIQSKVKTILSLMPLIIENLPKRIVDRIVLEYLTNNEEFFTPFLVPSVSKNETTFNPNSNDRDRSGIWRGPLSMNTNWFLVHGLRQHGYYDLADEIAKKSKELVKQHGFNEFYNPLTGEPVGANEFGWATLVVDM